MGDLLIDARDELADIAEVLKQPGYLESFGRDPVAARQLCQAVQDVVHAAEERQAVTRVLVDAGFYPSGQSLPDVVQEVVALAADGEDAGALLLEANFITESHCVHDALRGALAAAAATARTLDELQWSYELQKQCMNDLAVTARRLLISAHTVGGHSSKIHDCPYCVSDAFRIHMLGGLSI